MKHTQTNKNDNDKIKSFQTLSSTVSQDRIIHDQSHQFQQKKWMNVSELCAYLPDHPCRNTVYIWVSKRLIPFYKHSKHLYFRLAEIDAWIQSKRRMTFDEISNSVNKDMQSKLSGRKK
jgi:uncharacterized protein Usg